MSSSVNEIFKSNVKNLLFFVLCTYTHIIYASILNVNVMN